MGRLLRPAVILPALFGLAVLLALVTVADVVAVGDALARLHAITLIAVLAWLLLYEAIKFGAWWYVLRRAGLEPGPGALATAWLGYVTAGVLAALPGSLLAGCYVVSGRTPLLFTRAAGAATMMFWYEIVACLLLLAAVGLPPLPAAQPLALFLGAAALGVAMGVYAVGGRLRRERLPAWSLPWQHSLAELAGGMRIAGAPGVALTMTALCGAYLVAGSGALFSLIADLGPEANLMVALAGYAGAVLASLLSPVPFDIGMTEAGGVGGLVAWGYPTAPGLTALLTLRVARLAVNWLLMLVTVAVRREDLRGLLRRAAPP